MSSSALRVGVFFSSFEATSTTTHGNSMMGQTFGPKLRTRCWQRRNRTETSQGGRLALGPLSSLKTQNGAPFGPLFGRNGPLWEFSGDRNFDAGARFRALFLV